MAGETIDELKIEVEADASSASSSIDQLTKELNSLQGGLRSLNISKFNKLKQSLEEISSVTFDESLSGLSSISELIESMSNLPSANKFTRLANGLSSLNKADVSNMENVVYWVDKLSQSMSELNSGRSYNVNLNIGNQTATSEDVENTKGLAEALDAERASAENASEAMKEFKYTTDDIADSNEKTSQSAKNASESVGEVANAEKGIDSNKAKELGNEIRNTAEKAKESSGIIINFGKILGESFSSALEGIRKILSSLGKAGLGGLSSIFKTAGNAATTFGKKALTAAKNLGQVVANATPLGKIPAMFDKISSATDKLSSKLNRVIRLFTMMAMRSAFRTVMDELGTAFEHLALECDDVNQRYSQLISSMKQLAHNIAAVAQPILNIFGPALNYLISLLNTAITYVNQFLAALTGRTYTAAKYIPGDYAEGLEDAADAADDATEAQKRLNKQLQGFNELNNLTTSETSGSSGSTSGTGDEGEYTEGYYEELPIEQDILDFVDKLKEAWENADFTEIGNILGEKLKDALENIPWDEIQETAQKLAHSLATLINGFVETEGLGETIGNTIAQAINTALLFVDEFLTTVHWDSVGQFIADILNGAVDLIDWELLGKTLGDAIYAWLETIYNVITNFHWDDLGDSLAEAINTFVDRINIVMTSYDWVEVGANFAKGLNHLISGIEWDDLGESLANSFNAVLHSISGAIAVFDFGELGTDIATAMNSAFDKVDWSNIGTTIKNGINGAFEYVANWAGTFDWESFGKDLATSLNTALSGIDWETAITAADSIGRGIAKALQNVLTEDTFKNLGSTLAGALNTVFSGLYGLLDETNWSDLAKNVASGINEWLNKMDFEEMGRVLGKVLQSAITFLGTLVSSLSWSDVKSALQSFFKGMAEEVDMSEVGGIIAAALGVWIAGHFVSGVISAIGEGLGLKLALEIAGVTSTEITAAGASSFAVVAVAIAGALGLALANIAVEDITGGPEGILDAISGVIEGACEKLDNLSQPGGALYNFGEKLQGIVKNIFDATLGKLGFKWNDNEDTDQPEGEAYLEVEVGVDEESVEQSKQYLAGSFPEETYMTYTATATYYADKLIDNIDDKDKVIQCIGEIYKALFGENLTTEQLEGLVGVIDKLETNGQLEVGNVIASVYAYGKLVELQDDLSDTDKIVETVGELIDLFLGDNAKDYDVEGLTGELVDLIVSGADPVDVIGKITEFMVQNGITAQTEAEITDFLYDHDSRIALEAEVKDLIMDYNMNDSANRAEIIGRISTIMFGDNVSQTQIDGITAIVDKLESTGNLSIESVMAYVEAYGKLVELQDNLDDKDKVVETVGEIVDLLTNGNVDDYVVEGLRGKIEELITSGAEPVEIIGEIIDFLVQNGVLAETAVEATSVTAKEGTSLELRGYLVDLVNGIDDEEEYVRVIGEIYRLITGKEADDTVIDDLTGIIEKLEQKGQLTIDNVTAAVQAYGELVSLQDKLDDKDKVVDAAAKIIEMFTGEEASASQLDGVTAIITDILGNGGTIEDCIAEIVQYLNDTDETLDATANIVEIEYDMTQSALDVKGEMTVTAIDIPNSLKNVDGVTATITDLAKKGNLSVDEVAATVAQLYKEGSLSLDDISAVISKLTQNGTLSLSDVNAIISSLSKNGTLSLSDVSAVISSLTKSGTLTVSDVGAYISSLIKSGSLSISDVGAVISSLSKSGALSVSDITAVISSLSKSGTLTLSDIQGVISSLVKSGTLTLSDVQAIISSLSKNGTLSLSDISASVSSLSKSGSPSLAQIAASVSSVSAYGSPELAKIAATINSVSKSGSPSLSSISATVSDVSKSGSPSLASIAATINSVSKSGSPSLSNISASVNSASAASGTKLTNIAATINSVSKSGSPSLSSIAATVSSASPTSSAKLTNIKATVNSISNASTTPTLKNIKATVKSGGLSMSSSVNPALKNIKATVKSATVANSKNALLKNVKATVSSASARSGMSISGVGARVTRLVNGGASLSLSGTARSVGKRWSVTMRRRGGILRRGRWSGIPQYADGELNAGSLFIAGESGPELVGHIGGQTEVLNASQLASVMRNAVVAGISTLSTYLTSLYRHMTVCANGIIGAIAVNYDTPVTTPDVTTYNNFTDKSEIINQHEEDMDDVISLLTQIESNTEASEELASDPNGLFKIMRRKNNEYRSATGKSAFV